ncbi:MAG: hypothetical protein WBB07_04465 [Mycobacterium sp.]
MGDIAVVVYSSDAGTRKQVIENLGPRPHPGLAPLSYCEIATPAALIARLDRGGVDLAVLDGEATPAGGLGIARQLRDELDACPPLVVLMGRPADTWLANWSRADAAVPWPSDPITFSAVVVGALLARSGVDAR